MPDAFLARLGSELSELRSAGLYKAERPLVSAQSARIRTARRDHVNLCANNYLGLANDPRLVARAGETLQRYGFGLASVRFICGTQDLHLRLESELAAWLGTEDSLLFAACFDANGALFEPLFGAEDAIVSDALNHASLIDGIRLSKARRYRYAAGDMGDLRGQLAQARSGGARDVVIVTDGVFSMDGTLAPLPQIHALAEEFAARIVVDDCHATGVIGPQGRGTQAHFGLAPDILTGTFGKALGGAAGGYVAGPRAVIDLLRQKARPYLFSNALPPVITGASLEALGIVRSDEGEALRARLAANAAYWRAGLSGLGFRLLPGDHPIVPVMLGEAPLAQQMAAALEEEGVFVTGFFFPVVPRGQARIRTQMSAAHSRGDLDRALEAFARVGRRLGVI